MRLLIVIAALLVVPNAFADQYVHGYTRQDGTVVGSYYRSSSDSTVTDNYSYKGNTNPYTGETGHDYYRSSPSSQYYNYGSEYRSEFKKNGY